MDLRLSANFSDRVPLRGSRVPQREMADKLQSASPAAWPQDRIDRAWAAMGEMDSVRPRSPSVPFSGLNAEERRRHNVALKRQELAKRMPKARRAAEDYLGRASDVLARIGGTAWHSAIKAWDPEDPLGPDPETVSEWRRRGLPLDPAYGPVIYPFSAIAFQSIPTALDMGARSLNCAFHGGISAVGQTMREFGSPSGNSRRFERDMRAMPETLAHCYDSDKNPPLPLIAGENSRSAFAHTRQVLVSNLYNRSGTMIDSFDIGLKEVSIMFVESLSAMQNQSKFEKFKEYAKGRGGTVLSACSFAFDHLDEKAIEEIKGELDELLEEDECAIFITSVPAQSKKIILGKPVTRDVPIIVRGSD